MTVPFMIFLPVRNGADHIRAAIASVVGQTDGNWQLVVLENASADGTVDIVRSFADPRIVIEPSPTPLDIVDNWQRIHSWLKRNGGGNALVTMIGHDDLLYPEFVARIKTLAAAAPDATLYQTHFDIVDAEGGVIRPCRPIAESETWQDMAAMIGWGLRDSFGTGYAFRAEDYLRVGGIPPFPRILYADHMLFLRLARLGGKRADSANACAFRLHASSMSGQLSSDRLDDWIEAFDRFVDALESEFAEFVATDRGRSAMTSLLARELFVLDGPVSRRVTSADSQARLAKFRGLLIQLGGSENLGHWAYQAGRPMMGRLRRWKAQASVARSWLRRG